MENKFKTLNECTGSIEFVDKAKLREEAIRQIKFFETNEQTLKEKYGGNPQTMWHYLFKDFFNITIEDLQK